MVSQAQGSPKIDRVTGPKQRTVQDENVAEQSQ